jgi:hypothetical protein
MRRHRVSISNERHGMVLHFETRGAVRPPTDTSGLATTHPWLGSVVAY